MRATCLIKNPCFALLLLPFLPHFSSISLCRLHPHLTDLNFVPHWLRHDLISQYSSPWALYEINLVFYDCYLVFCIRKFPIYNWKQGETPFFPLEVWEMLPRRGTLCQVLIAFLLYFAFLFPSLGERKGGGGHLKIIEQGENECSLNSRIQEGSFHRRGL